MFPKRYFSPEFFAQNYFPPVESGSGTTQYGEISFEGEGVFTLTGKRVVRRRARLPLVTAKTFASVSFRGTTQGNVNADKDSIASLFLCSLSYGVIRADKAQHNTLRATVKSRGSLQSNVSQFSSIAADKIATRGSAVGAKQLSSLVAIRAATTASFSSSVLESLIHISNARCFKKEQSAMTTHETTFHKQPAPNFTHEGRVIQSRALRSDTWV
jgi:hypothetical protein